MGDQYTTSIIELVVVGMGVAVGMVYLANNWPSPEPPLIVAGAATAAFMVYMVVAAVVERRRCAELAASQSAQSQAAAEAGQHSEQPRQAQPISQTQQAAQQEADEQQADEQLAEVPVVALGAPSEDPTAFLQIDELRAETDADITGVEEGAMPSFAESTMNLSQRNLARGARQLRTQGEPDAAGQSAPKQPAKPRSEKPQSEEPQSEEQASVEDQKTELTPLDRLRQKIESEEEA